MFWYDLFLVVTNPIRATSASSAVDLCKEYSHDTTCWASSLGVKRDWYEELSQGALVGLAGTLVRGQAVAEGVLSRVPSEVLVAAVLVVIGMARARAARTLTAHARWVARCTGPLSAVVAIGLVA